MKMTTRALSTFTMATRTVYIVLHLIPDIAIGSPYEDDYKGAVYIYNGYKDGLYHLFSQRIEAAQIDPGLRGFGISLSKPADLNSDRISGTLSRHNIKFCLYYSLLSLFCTYCMGIRRVKIIAVTLRC